MNEEYLNKRQLTLFIDTWDSKCGNCGRSCNPRSKTHDINYGYDMKINGTPGCGVEWQFVSSNYFGVDGLNENIKKMRPDLEFWGFDYGSISS
jgi:hypothetical protein